MVDGSRFKVQSSRFEVKGSRLKVQVQGSGSRFEVQGCESSSRFKCTRSRLMIHVSRFTVLFLIRVICPKGKYWKFIRELKEILSWQLEQVLRITPPLKRGWGD
jgi:hypothetical protein